MLGQDSRSRVGHFGGIVMNDARDINIAVEREANNEA
jgi:hypothetical protein